MKRTPHIKFSKNKRNLIYKYLLDVFERGQNLKSIAKATGYSYSTILTYHTIYNHKGDSKYKQSGGFAKLCRDHFKRKERKANATPPVKQAARVAPVTKHRYPHPSDAELLRNVQEAIKELKAPPKRNIVQRIIGNIFGI